MTEQQFIIRKGGYYYRPNAQGYTSSLLEAGRYAEAEAVAHMEHCDPGEITIFPAPAVPASPTLPQDIAATAERIVLEHIAASLDIDGSSAGTRLDMLAIAIATALEIERTAAPPRHHLMGSADGWKLVPIKPTEDMLDAALGVHESRDGEDEEFFAEFRRTYRAMLSAVIAPDPAGQVDIEDEIARVVQSVNEWDDRTSPDDYPEHLLITSEELTLILRNFAAAIASTEGAEG